MDWFKRRHRLELEAACIMAVAALVGSACTSAGNSDARVTAPTDPSQSTATTAVIEGGTAPGGPAAVASWNLDAALAADANCAQPVTGDPLRIGFAADLSELGSFSDGPGSQSALYLGKLINCSGGFNGRPVEVLVQDVSGTPTQSRDATKKLIDAGVQVIIGPPFPDIGFRVLQVTNGAIPVLFMASTEEALGDSTDLGFQVAFNDTAASTAAAKFALTQGWTRAVTFSLTGDPYFGYNTLIFSGVFSSNGGKMLGDYPFVPGETTDFSAAVAAIAALPEPPDVIYTPMLSFQVVALRKQLTAAGINVEYLMSDAFEITRGYDLAGTDGIFHVTHSFPAEGSRALALENSLAGAAGGPSGAPSMVALAGDAMSVIAAAYYQTQSADPKVLGAAIPTLNNVQGVTGLLSYNGSGSPTKNIYVHKVVDGKPTLAATIDG
jgi:branched-chain amino acid transport system substrate-binding protein